MPQPQDQNQATNTTPAQPQPQPATKQTATAAPKADFSIQWNTNAPMLALNGRPLHTGANLSTILFDQATKVTVGDNTLAVKVPLGDMSADQYTINGLGMGQGTLSSLQ
ncbi:hypothetical protein ACTMR5_15705, partial [Enterococcus faecium]|uniref:hypothetical protein n=1 Tax=Enterococcus faecium TaxID=1352 RepID=UPI003F8AA05A